MCEVDINTKLIYQLILIWYWFDTGW